MPKYQFLACQPMTRGQLAPPLRLSDVRWSEAVSANGEMTASLAVPDNSTIKSAEIGAVVDPDASAIYIKNLLTNQFEWGGVVVGSIWDPRKESYQLRIAEWRSWLYNVFLGPKVDLSGDNTYSWTAVDQFQIAREVVAYATSGGSADGRPSITLGSDLSGKVRDLNFVGLNFKAAGEVLDSISQRSGGFEWSLDVFADDLDLLPRLRLGTYLPERGGVLDGLIFKITPGGSNCTLTEPIEKSSLDLRTRCWATGEAETQPFAVDSDPDLALGAGLLRERVDNYSSVIDRTTLASHARAMRLFTSPKTTLMKVRAPLDTPILGTARAGHRGRLLYRDSQWNLDLPAVRIISREVRPYTGAGEVEFVLDLSDYKAPEVDSAGAV